MANQDDITGRQRLKSQQFSLGGEQALVPEVVAEKAGKRVDAVQGKAGKASYRTATELGDCRAYKLRLRCWSWSTDLRTQDTD